MVTELVASVAVGPVGQVEIGEGDRSGCRLAVPPSVMAPATSTGVMTGASLLPVTRMVTSWVVGAAVAVVHGDGEHQRDGFAGGQEVEVGVGDRVIPVDRAVVGVTAGR